MSNIFDGFRNTWNFANSISRLKENQKKYQILRARSEDSNDEKFKKAIEDYSFYMQKMWKYAILSVGIFGLCLIAFTVLMFSSFDFAMDHLALLIILLVLPILLFMLYSFYAAVKLTNYRRYAHYYFHGKMSDPLVPGLVISLVGLVLIFFFAFLVTPAQEPVLTKEQIQSVQNANEYLDNFDANEIYEDSYNDALERIKNATADIHNAKSSIEDDSNAEE